MRLIECMILYTKILLSSSGFFYNAKTMPELSEFVRHFRF